MIDGGDGRAVAGAALGRARALSGTLATLEGILGVDFRELSRGIAGKITEPTDGQRTRPPTSKSA